MTMWVLTRSINQYDQDGDYFERVFATKPTVEELVGNNGFFEGYAKYLLDTGGGRIKDENEWYYLKEIGHGEQYIHSCSIHY